METALHQIATVIPDLALDRPLDYLVPGELAGRVLPGMRVEISIRNRAGRGTVLSLRTETPTMALKPLTAILSDEATLPPDLMQLAEWIASYYCAPLSRVLSSMLPASLKEQLDPPKQLFVESLLSKEKLREQAEVLRQNKGAQAAVLDCLLKQPKGMLLTELLEKADVSRSPVDSLVKMGILSCQPLWLDKTVSAPFDYFPTYPKALTEEQQAALAQISASLEAEKFAVHLLFGITGSGKTEVYLQAIEKALAMGKTALLLVPEVSLTAPNIEKLEARLRQKIAVLHHRVSDGDKRSHWQQLLAGKARIAVGARSALFAPLQNLGLILVDEEHEASYKQTEEAPCYHARDVATIRARILGATLILGSATPSLESFYSAESGRYQLQKLTSRATGANLPQVRVVDMRDEFAKNKGFTLFSQPLLDGIQKRLKLGEQVLLFLNRRGYHSCQVCLGCGKAIECTSCSMPMTFHLEGEMLRCHLCDQARRAPKACPSCHKEDSMKFRGVGTQQVERALHAVLPEVRTLRMDADTTRHKGSHETLLRDFRCGKADLLIGTQMVAKGLHFPSVTLVGVLYADAALQIPDFRAAEQAFQKLTQVAGRSGRSALPGEVVLQTNMPDSPLIAHACSQDFESFYREEIEIRKLFQFPPFTRLIKCQLSGKQESLTQQTAEALRQLLQSRLPPTCSLLPVVASGHARVKDHYQFQFLIKSPSPLRLAPLINEWYKLPASRAAQLLVDIDPISTYF